MSVFAGQNDSSKKSTVLLGEPCKSTTDAVNHVVQYLRRLKTGPTSVKDTSIVPPIVFVDDEGLEEQILTEDEASQKIMDVTANCVTTPVEDDAAPLNPIYMQRSQRDEDLDLQPSRGSREGSFTNAFDQFL